MKPENLKCPQCEGEMIPRTNRRDNTKFWGCKNYPSCRGTRNSMGLSKSEIDELRADSFDNDEDKVTWSRRYD